MRAKTTKMRVIDARSTETVEVRSNNTLYRVIQAEGPDVEQAVQQEITRFAQTECPIPLLLLQGMHRELLLRRDGHGRVIKGPAVVEFASAMAICSHMDKTDVAILRTSAFQDMGCRLPVPLLNSSVEIPEFALDVASTHACSITAQHALETLHLAASIQGVWQRLDVGDDELALLIPERAFFRIDQVE